MDFHTLSRPELQVLCKRNNVRANMTNAAMAEALESLDFVSPNSIFDELDLQIPCLHSQFSPRLVVVRS
jgi:hypothetical protein